MKKLKKVAFKLRMKKKLEETSFISLQPEVTEGLSVRSEKT
jgi:hypothetical protein